MMETSAKKSKEPEFIPGVIVKIESTKPLNRKQIKVSNNIFKRKNSLSHMIVLFGWHLSHNHSISMVIVVPYAAQAAGVKLVGVLQAKPIHRVS